MIKFRHLACLTALLACSLASPDASRANDIAPFKTVYNTDFTSAGVGGLRNLGTGFIRLSQVSGRVTEAYLYWHGPTATTNPRANAVVQVNGQTVEGEQIGFSNDNCWAYPNSQAYRADVTALVAAQGNGVYVLTGFFKGNSININGVSLIVFFEDGNTKNNRDIVLFDGNDSNKQNIYDADGWNVSLPGILYSTGEATVQLHVSDGQEWLDEALLINGTTVIPAGHVFDGDTNRIHSANNGPVGNGALWDIQTLDATRFLHRGVNTLRITHAHVEDNDCVSLVIAVINLPSGAAPPPEVVPQVFCSPDLTVPTDAGKPTALVSFTVTATPASATVVCAPSSGTAFSTGLTTVRCTATDTNNLSATCTFTVRVSDTEVPRLICPLDMVRNVDADLCSAVVTFTPVATDNLPGVTFSCQPPSGSVFPKGVTPVHCTATDVTGLSTNATFRITVIDNIPPRVSMPQDVVLALLSGRNDGVANYTVTAQDNCPGVTVTGTPPSGSVFLLGTNNVRVVATDATGNITTGSFRVILGDRQLPIINTPPDITVPTDPGKCSAVVTYEVTVTDNVDGATLICAPSSGSEFVKGATVVTCSAADASGNRATNSFKVTVVDREVPVIDCPPDLIISPPSKKKLAFASYRVTATDNCPGVRVTTTPPSGSGFSIGATVVTVTATDAAGNRSTCTFKVIVRDPKHPKFKVKFPKDIKAKTDRGQCSAAVDYKIKVDTKKHPGAVLTCVPPSGTIFVKGTSVVNCTATDGLGEVLTGTFPVLVEDKERPVISTPADIVVEPDAGKTTAVVSYTVTGSDNCPDLLIECQPPSGSTFGLGSTTVHCKAIDGAGNDSSRHFKVNVINCDGPEIKSISASPKALPPANHQLVPVTVHVSVTDKCGKVISRIVSVSSSQPVTSADPGDATPDWVITGPLTLQLRAEATTGLGARVYTVTVECTDPLGKTATATVLVTAPVASGKPPRK